MARLTTQARAGSAEALSIAARPPEQPLPDPATWGAPLTADNLKALLGTERDGYWHFQISHQLALEWEYKCTLCHSAQVPFYPVNNTESKLAQSQVCQNCHGRIFQLR